MSPIVIIGGGITGLASAWELQQLGVDYTLLEASDRLGGKLITERTDGFIIEAGADSFLTAKPWAWQLCHEIGFADQLIPTNQEQRAVYIYWHGKLQPIPRGMRLIVPLDADGLLESDLLSEAGKRRMLAETTIPPRLDEGDESLATFVRRRFGPEALEVFGDSLLSGIHASDPERLSIRAAFPNYPRFERDYGSVSAGMKAAPARPIDPDLPSAMFVSPRDGMISLIEALREKLTGTICLNAAVERIDADRTIHLAKGETLHPDAVILTTPANAAGSLVGAISADLSRDLAAFKAVSSGTVSLGFRADAVSYPLDGYGFVIPRSEPTRITACTWSSTKLAGRAPDGFALIRVFIGGHGRESDVALSDDELIQLARRELHATMGIQVEPVLARVFRWRAASPQYEVGHLERLRELTACPPWLRLAGCAYDGVGVPDCVRQGREAAQNILGSI